MTHIAVPANAVGRPGMVAMLKRMKSGDNGKLVALRCPVGYITSLASSRTPVFAWQVLMLGEINQPRQEHCREMMVADVCLVPVSQIEPAAVEALVKAMAKRDFDRAMADLRHVLVRDEVTPAQFETALADVAEFMSIQRALELVPVAVALKELGFRADGADGDSLRWSGMHGGVELYVTAGEDMFGGWTLVGTRHTARQAMWDERRMLGEAPRGMVALRVLDLWRTAHGPHAQIPDVLQAGRLYEQHQADLRKVGMGLPTLQLDGEVLRATRRWLLSRQCVGEDFCGPLPDQALALSFNDGLLRFELSGEVFGCPAQGVWVEDCSISLREFLAILPSRLRGRQVELRRSISQAALNGWPVSVQL